MEVLPAPFLQRFIDELKQSPRQYSYSDVRHGHPEAPPDFAADSQPPPLGDRLTVLVPHCRAYFMVEVIFHYDKPDLPPDLVVENGGDWLDLKSCKTLLAWNAQSSLVTMLDEVLDLYRAHKEEAVRTHPNERLRYEYNTVCSLPGIEYHVEGTSVKLLIPLCVNLRPIFQVFLNRPVASERCFYAIEFEAPPAGPLRVARAELHWPAPLVPFPWLVEHTFPVLSLDRGGCLVDFIPDLEASITEMLTSRLSRYHKRRELCEGLVTTFGSPLEYDAMHFGSIAFLFDGPAPYVMQVSMPEGLAAYPAEPPFVHLTSLCASELVDGRPTPVRCRLLRFPYEANMSGVLLGQALRWKLLEVQKDFVQLCESHMAQCLLP